MYMLTVQCTLHCTVLYCAVLCCTVLYCAVLCCTVLYCAVLCCTVLYCAVLCCTVLYCAVLCCTVLYCAVLKFHWRISVTEVYKGVCLEPVLQPLDGERLNLATANMEDNARADIRARGFWGNSHQKNVIF